MKSKCCASFFDFFFFFLKQMYGQHLGHGFTWVFVYFTHTRPLEDALQDKFSSVIPKMKDSPPKGMKFASSLQNAIAKFITCAPFQPTGVRAREQRHRQRPCLPFRKWLPKPQRVNLEHTSLPTALCFPLWRVHTSHKQGNILSRTHLSAVKNKKNKQQPKRKTMLFPRAFYIRS